MSEEPPLPYGWIKEFDSNYQQYFYVDTKADPPRSIWVHPYKDEQFLREHPDIREKIGSNFETPPGPPPFEDRASSYGTQGAAASSSSIPAGPEKRGLFGKLIGKTVGTREEREAARRAEEEQQQRILQEQRRRMEEQQRAYPGQYPYSQQRPGGFGAGYGAGGYGGGGYGGGGYGGPPPAGYYPQQQQQQGYYPPPQQQPARRSGMGGMALPLVGGLAGGLLLGEALDGFGGDGGDGGDFGGDGGDFGGDGGDFGGGDF